jgi:pimeloyl-ACP methyl ester carboxylesterase
MTEPVLPYKLNVPETDLRDLWERLARIRWPEPTTVPDTSQGPRLEKLKSLVSYWSGGYDWRKSEERLNTLGSYHTVIDGLDIHFLHVRSPEPDALPLVMTHGWPESILDFEKMVGPLSDPAAHGGDRRDAFHLVIPSLPGFGFSGKPWDPGWGPRRTAQAWITLMRRLGYERWAAHGSDVGHLVTDAIARSKPAGLVGVHFPFVSWPASAQEIASATDAEKEMLASADHFWSVRAGYCVVQMNRPQTIGYSLADSPVGLAAWLYNMLQDGCGTPGDAEKSFTQDEILDLIMMYWLPNAGTSAARMYWEMARNSHLNPAAERPEIDVPAGFVMFPYDALRKSRRWIEARYTNIVRFTEAASGGHYSALEEPGVLVDELRATFRELRVSAK